MHRRNEYTVTQPHSRSVYTKDTQHKSVHACVLNCSHPHTHTHTHTHTQRPCRHAHTNHLLLLQLCFYWGVTGNGMLLKWVSQHLVGGWKYMYLWCNIYLDVGNSKSKSKENVPPHPRNTWITDITVVLTVFNGWVIWTKCLKTNTAIATTIS